MSLSDQCSFMAFDKCVYDKAALLSHHLPSPTFCFLLTALHRYLEYAKSSNDIETLPERFQSANKQVTKSVERVSPYFVSLRHSVGLVRRPEPRGFRSVPPASGKRYLIEMMDGGVAWHDPEPFDSQAFYATASRPCFSISESSFKEGPAGFFSPRSH